MAKEKDEDVVGTRRASVFADEGRRRQSVADMTSNATGESVPTISEPLAAAADGLQDQKSLSWHPKGRAPSGRRELC